MILNWRNVSEVIVLIHLEASLFFFLFFVFLSFPLYNKSIFVCINMSSIESRLIFFLIYSTYIFFETYGTIEKKSLRQVCPHTPAASLIQARFVIVKLRRFFLFIYIYKTTGDRTVILSMHLSL